MTDACYEIQPSALDAGAAPRNLSVTAWLHTSDDPGHATVYGPMQARATVFGQNTPDEVQLLHCSLAPFEAEPLRHSSDETDHSLCNLAAESDLMGMLLQSDCHLYDGIRAPHDCPYLHHISCKFSMPEQLYASGVQQYNLWFHQSDHGTIEELRRFIRDTRESFSQLTHDVLSLGAQWAECQKALCQYLHTIEMGGMQISPPAIYAAGNKSTWYSDPSANVPGSLPASAFVNAGSSQESSSFSSMTTPSSLRDEATTRTSPASTSNLSPLSGDIGCEELKSDPFYCQGIKAFDPDLCREIWQGTPDAPASTMALLGWIHYGQILAPSLSIYARVYIRLVQTGLVWE